MTEVAVPREHLPDPVGLRGWPDDPGRDEARTPMQWTGERTGGFTGPGIEPWLPIGDTTSCNVTDQRDDPGSMLRLCRDLIALRRAHPDLLTWASAPVEGPPDQWMWRRGDRTVVVVNCSDGPSEAPRRESSSSAPGGSERASG